MPSLVKSILKIDAKQMIKKLIKFPRSAGKIEKSRSKYRYLLVQTGGDDIQRGKLAIDWIVSFVVHHFGSIF